MKEQTTNTWCIVGFICAFVIPLLGIIFSIMGLAQVSKSNEKGKGLAIAGLIISSIYTLIALLIIIVFSLAAVSTLATLA